MKRPIISATVVTAYLVVYTILTQIPTTQQDAFYMFLASPAFVIWMALTVLRDRHYKSRSPDREEFGYRDKPLQRQK